MTPALDVLCACSGDRYAERVNLWFDGCANRAWPAGGVPMSEGDTTQAWMGIPWLADAPMFIDAAQVSSFYDAVIGPEFRTVQLQVSAERNEQLQKSFGAKLGAGLPLLFPWLKLDGEVDTARARTAGQVDTQSIVVQPIENAARQLVKLSLHYKMNHPERIWFHEGPEWRAGRTVVGSGVVGRGSGADGRRVECCRRAAAAPG
jgi:hypothetical protein